MEKKKPLVTDELIIVGGRHGELSDKLIPLFSEGNPIEEKDIRKEIGCEIVYLMRSNNDHDPYAIGVFTSSMKRLGYLWVHQSYAKSRGDRYMGQTQAPLTFAPDYR